MAKCDLGNLIRKMNSAVLEVNISNEENKDGYLEGIEREVNNMGYSVSKIMESQKDNGLYHIHIIRKGEIKL